MLGLRPQRKLSPALASDLASQLRHLAAAIAPAIHTSLRDRVRIDSPDQTRLELELLCFCIHLVDMAAFREFGESETREKLIDEVGRLVFSSFVAEKCGSGPSIDPMGEQLLGLLNKRQTWLSEFKEFVPRKGASLKGALVWEFSKHVTTLFSAEPVRVMAVCADVTTALQLTDKLVKAQGWKGLLDVPN